MDDQFGYSVFGLFNQNMDFGYVIWWLCGCYDLLNVSYLLL
jgi:hypothetical protein